MAHLNLSTQYAKQKTTPTKEEKKSFEAGNLPDKYDKYSGGNDYALLLAK